MANKLVVITNSLKVAKIKKILLYEMKFLVPNYSCLQNHWLGGYRPQIPVLSVLCPQLNLLNPPPPNKIPQYAAGGGCYDSVSCRSGPPHQYLKFVCTLNVLHKLDLWCATVKSVALHYWPVQAVSLQQFEASRIGRHSAHEDGKVVSPTRRPPLPLWVIPATHFC